jgi:RNA exonuclease 4
MSAKYLVPSLEQIVALACTNVGVGPGGTTSMVAYVHPTLFATGFYAFSSRVSIVDYRGHAILDTFVAPTMQIQDYRGLEPKHLHSSTV